VGSGDSATVTARRRRQSNAIPNADVRRIHLNEGRLMSNR
jgi:hypothetical protein